MAFVKRIRNSHITEKLASTTRIMQELKDGHQILLRHTYVIKYVYIPLGEG